MADDDNKPPRDWGHHKSPFFKLPPEIRNKIYRETFTGSKIDLVIDPPLDVDVVPITGRRSIFSTVNSNHHFLLTCFQVYCEALALYWSSTVVRNGCNGHFSRAYFLNSIPAIARPYIQHLRGVKLTPTRNLKWVRGRHPNVHFLDKQVDDADQESIFEDYGEYCPIDLERFTFWNISFDRTLSWLQPHMESQWLSDEDAFEILMNPAPNEIESIESEFELETLSLFEI